jgi:beta-aspartyl-dipeptidase (metallo-type)
MLIVRNAEVYAPAPRGKQTLVLAGGRIEAMLDAGVDVAAVERALDAEVLDATGCIAAPGLIDAHVHLIGGSGESGFASQTPGVGFTELITSGITTVVGTLGTDTTTKTLPALLGHVKGLREEGLNAWMWTGGYDARSITGSVRDDIILIAEVLGAGELAIADRRGMHYTPLELARLATDCYVAGTFTGKAGVLHLHTGEGSLRVLQEVLDGFPVEATTLHPTHVNRSERLFREAIELTRRGVTVDLDTFEESIAKWMRLYDGDRALVTISSDAAINSPRTLLEQIGEVVAEGVLPLEEALALATRNVARVLKLRDAGALEKGKRADVLLLDAGSLTLRHLILGGELVIRDGAPLRQERYREKGNRWQ